MPAVTALLFAASSFGESPVAVCGDGKISDGEDCECASAGSTSCAFCIGCARLSAPPAEQRRRLRARTNNRIPRMLTAATSFTLPLAVPPELVAGCELHDDFAFVGRGLPDVARSVSRPPPLWQLLLTALPQL